MKIINIQNPCSENWEMMSPREKGKFCSVCNKCVIDFTQKHPDEIQRIIEEKKDEEVCGRFYNHQLNKVDQSEKLKAQFFKYIPTNFQNNKITLTVFSLILFLMGCSKQQNESCTTTTGMMVSNVETDTVKNKDYIMGEAKIVENDSVAKIYKKDSIAVKSKSSKK